MANHFYPEGPSFVPADLTTPGKSYKKHVWIASAALLLFMVLYLGLSTWFLYKAYSLFTNAVTGGRDTGLSLLVSILLGFLGVFMFKALFFISKKDKSQDIEITKEDEPELFEFIYKLADEAKAPRPHKVFLSNTVNACVFYDVSVINLIFPSRKNLEIGLGLINTLNLGEFKSILAHEFGHFTQRSMIIGRWVYIANKVAYQIVAKRDGLDSFIKGLSRLDFRIAWIGWILSIFVWSLRSFSEVLFKLVLLTQRALSREMEFHADLVAVSLTGSDALIHSLYKLSAADNAYDEAIEFVNKQLKKKKAVSDVYAVQSNVIRHMAVVLNNPSYGVAPKIENGDGSKYKVFKEQIAQTPKMWSTHPSNIDREKNAKRTYINARIDERSSWVLFKDADKVKNKMTLALYKNLKVETTPLAKEDSIGLHDKDFLRSYLLPKYRGVYVNRLVLVSFKTVKDLYDLKLDTADIEEQFPLLYPEPIQQQLEYLKNLDEEIMMLEGLNNKALTASEGKIKYRDRELSRKELPAVIENAKKEAEIERNRINAHDKLCRNVHYAAAKKIGNGWDGYLISLATVVHYCEHTQKEIEAQSRFFYDTLAIISRIRSVSSSELAHLISAANDLHFSLGQVFSKSKTIRLSSRMTEQLDGKKFAELLEPFQLNPAAPNNINSWITAVGSWTNLAMNAIIALRQAALDELIQSEEYVAEMVLTSAHSIEPAPEPIVISDDYAKFDPDKKRVLFKRDDLLSHFENPNGIVPAIGRFAIAASIILFAVIYAGNIGSSNVVVYNGLPVDVIVHIGGKSVKVEHDNSSELLVDNVKKLDIETTTLKGEPVEKFTAELQKESRTYVYNVANAAVMYAWVAYYGSMASDNRQKLLGAQRWMEVKADHYFEEPPRSVSLQAGQSESRTVVAAYKAFPSQLATLISDENERNNFLSGHALWEQSTSPTILSWLALAANLKNFPEIIHQRLLVNPLEVASLRMEQEVFKGNEKQRICEEQNQLYSKNPDNADLYYLKTRCMENEAQKDSAFIAGYKKWPDNPWLAYASGFTFVQKEDWEKAMACFNTVYTKEPALRAAITEEMKRICQLQKQDAAMEAFTDLESPYLNYLKSIDNSYNADPENKLYAYKLLSEGKIGEAINFCESDTVLQAGIIRLAAISDGVSDEIIQKAISLPATAGIDGSTIMPAIALSAKRNLSLDIYKESLKNSMGDYADSVFLFIEYTKSNRLAESTKMLASLNAEMKGKMCLLGVALLGNKAPEKWTLFASQLLFIDEKPYHGPDTVN